MTRGFRGFSLVVLLGATACGEHPLDDPPTTTVAAVKAATGDLARDGLAGRDLYVRYCAVCHGAAGAGDGFNAGNLAEPPPPLKERASALGTKGLRAHLRRGADDFYPQSRCPPYGANLTEKERRVLLGYVVDLPAAEPPETTP